jgi:hypothetical protein
VLGAMGLCHVIIIIVAVIGPFIGSALRGIRISMQRKGMVSITIALSVIQLLLLMQLLHLVHLVPFLISQRNLHVAILLVYNRLYVL